MLNLFVSVHYRCTLNPSDQLAMEGPLSRVKSIKKSLRQSFRRIRRSRVSLRKHHVNNTAKVDVQPGGTSSPCLLGLLRLDVSCRSLFLRSSRRPTLVWRRSWQKWSWRRCRGRSRPAPQTTLSPDSYGRCTSPTPSSQTVSRTVDQSEVPSARRQFVFFF